MRHNYRYNTERYRYNTKRRTISVSVFMENRFSVIVCGNAGLDIGVCRQFHMYIVVTYYFTVRQTQVWLSSQVQHITYLPLLNGKPSLTL